MVELVKYIVDQLVDDKSAVNITTEENDGVETITINVAEGDIGKVIGKQGKIAMSIRTLAKAVGIKGDDIFSLVLWVLPLAIVGCRIYYVIAEWDQFRDNLIEIFDIRDGGIAMYGGTIAGVITVIIWSRCKKIPFGATLDIGASGLILGQVIGRWANFVNREAFGYETDVFCRMGLTQPGQETVYVHPTFLYESLWNLVGFIIIDR